MNVDKFEIFRALGVPPRGILIRSIEARYWGSRRTLSCVYDADNPKAFDLIFSGCTKCVWEERSEISEHDSVADVIGILLGEKHHVHPASINTDIFSMEISYDELDIIKNW